MFSVFLGWRHREHTKRARRHVATPRAGLEATEYKDDGYQCDPAGQDWRNLEDERYQRELLGGFDTHARYVKLVRYVMWGRVQQA